MVPLILTTASLDDFRLCHLLMVSSSSESQKLVVSSSLLIMVLELSYPARWRSNRLWPFMRGPDRWQENFPSSFKSTLTKMINALYLLPYFCQPLYIVEVFGRHNLFFIIRTVFSLTVLLHALSVPRSLPPEGNDRFGLRLLIQGLHAARRIGTVAEKHAYKRAFFFFSSSKYQLIILQLVDFCQKFCNRLLR